MKLYEYEPHPSLIIVVAARCRCPDGDFRVEPGKLFPVSLCGTAGSVLKSAISHGVKSQPSSHSEVVVDDTQGDKLVGLNIDRNLSISLMSGLVNVLVQPNI